MLRRGDRNRCGWRRLAAFRTRLLKSLRRLQTLRRLQLTPGFHHSVAVLPLPFRRSVVVKFGTCALIHPNYIVLTLTLSLTLTLNLTLTLTLILISRKIIRAN